MIVFQISPYVLTTTLFVLLSLAAAHRLAYLGSAGCRTGGGETTGAFLVRAVVQSGALFILYLQVRNLLTVSFPHQGGIDYLVDSNRIVYVTGILAVSLFLAGPCWPSSSKLQALFFGCAALLIVIVLEIALGTGRYTEKNYPFVLLALYAVLVPAGGGVHHVGMRQLGSGSHWLDTVRIVPRRWIPFLESPLPPLIALVPCGILCFLSWQDRPLF